MTIRADLRDRNQVTIPAEVRSALHVGVGDMVEFVVDDESVRIRGLKAIPADQAWFWTTQWQAMESEADEAIKAGKMTRYDSDEEFLASLTDV